ncbi:MAG TPA: corrinoid protein [Anaerolineales bacterium]|nr:corrinoid protein [Anaerolineales bacterium]
MVRLETIYRNVIAGQAQEVEQGVQGALDQGIDADVILNESLIPAMGEVGKRFEEGEFFVPEMLISARAMKAGLAILKPYLVDSGVESAGIVAIGTVQGDLHDIGKNLVAVMLEGAGFEVRDLGVDVPPETFVDAANEGAQVIGLSALLTTTMPKMEQTIQAMREANVLNKVSVIIGGAPVTESYAQQIGADAFAPDASSATRVVRQLIE